MAKAGLGITRKRQYQSRKQRTGSSAKSLQLDKIGKASGLPVVEHLSRGCKDMEVMRPI